MGQGPISKKNLTINHSLLSLYIELCLRFFLKQSADDFSLGQTIAGKRAYQYQMRYCFCVHVVNVDLFSRVISVNQILSDTYSKRRRLTQWCILLHSLMLVS